MPKCTSTVNMYVLFVKSFRVRAVSNLPLILILSENIDFFFSLCSAQLILWNVDGIYLKTPWEKRHMSLIIIKIYDMCLFSPGVAI